MATSTLGFTEMDDSDPLAQVAAEMRASVDAIDAHLRLAETGQAWQAFTLTNWSAVAGWPASRYRKKAGMREVRVEIAATRTTSNLAAGGTLFTLAAGFWPTANQTVIGYLTTGAVAIFTIATTGAVTCNAAINIGISAIFCGDISLD